MHSQNILDIEQSKNILQIHSHDLQFSSVINSTCLGTMHDKTKMQNMLS